MKFHRTIPAIFMASLLAVCGRLDGEPIDEITKILRSEALPENLPSYGKETDAAKLTKLLLGAPNDSSRAMIKLWGMDQPSKVAEMWWRSQSSEVRILCLALVTQTDVDPAELLPTLEDYEGYSRRFSDNEAMQRLEEIRTVQKNGELLRDLIRPLLAKAREAARPMPFLTASALTDAGEFKDVKIASEKGVFLAKTLTLTATEADGLGFKFSHLFSFAGGETPRATLADQMSGPGSTFPRMRLSLGGSAVAELGWSLDPQRQIVASDVQIYRQANLTIESSHHDQMTLPELVKALSDPDQK